MQLWYNNEVQWSWRGWGEGRSMRVLKMVNIDNTSYRSLTIMIQSWYIMAIRCNNNDYFRSIITIISMELSTGRLLRPECFGAFILWPRQDRDKSSSLRCFCVSGSALNTASTTCWVFIYFLEVAGLTPFFGVCVCFLVGSRKTFVNLQITCYEWWQIICRLKCRQSFKSRD